MKILIDISHPAHAHQFRNAIKILKSKGHEIAVTARNKEVTLDLLDRYGIEYLEVGEHKNNIFEKGLQILTIDYKLYQFAKKFNPDVLVGGVGNVYVSHVSYFLNKPSILFNDTEHGRFQNLLSYPFASTIFTPTCYTKSIGKKQVKYNGYHELAYLHPKYFHPDPTVLSDLGIKETEPFIILRFVSWDANTDVGQCGINNKLNFVTEISKYGKVFISSESSVDPELEKYKIKVSPDKLHDLLYYATLYIGEGATTASECAVLGTNAIYVNTLRLGYLDEEERIYGLVSNFSDPKTMEKNAFEKALELLKNPNLKSEGQQKRRKLLHDKIDVTEFMVKSIEGINVKNY